MLLRAPNSVSSSPSRRRFRFSLLCTCWSLLAAADPLVIAPGATVDIGDPAQPSSQGYDSLTVGLGGTLNLLGNVTLNIAGDIVIDGSITATPGDHAQNGTPGQDGTDGPNNQPTGLNAGTGGTLGQSGQNWTSRAPPRLEFISQGTVIVRGSITLNPKFDGGNGGRGGHGGHGGTGMDGPGSSAAVGGFGGQAGSGAAGGHGGLEGPTLRITASQIELRSGSRISLDNLAQGGKGADGGNGGNGARGANNTGQGRGGNGGGGGPAGNGGQGGVGGNGGTLWLTADRISLGGQISLRGGPGGAGGQAGIPGSGGDGGNASGTWPGGGGGNAGNPGLTAFRGGTGGRGGSGGNLYVRTDELLAGFVFDIGGGEGGEGGEGRDASLAKGGQGGSGSPGGQAGFDSGTMEPGPRGEEGLEGRVHFYVNWNVVPSDVYWQITGSPDCGGPFVETDSELITRRGFTLCAGHCASHLVNVDSEFPFLLEFDHRWLTTAGTLEVYIGDQLVHSLEAPPVLDPGFTRASVALTDPALRSPFLQQLRVCVSSGESAMVQVAALVFRADPAAGIPPPNLSIGPVNRGTPIELSWSSAAGHNYQLQSSGSLAAGSWNDVGSAIAGTGSTVATSVTPESTQAAAFYRVVVLQHLLVRPRTRWPSQL